MDKPAETTISEASQGKMEGPPSTALDEVSGSSENMIIQTSETPEITPIAELRPNAYNKVIEVRVYRKWISVTYGKKNESGFSPKKKENAFCCILIDKEGNAIQANMNVKEIDYFDPKIKLGSVYRISDFMCQPTDPYQQTIENKTSLRFGKITKFSPITAPGIPHHYFKFVSYNQLQSKIPKEDETGKTRYPVLTDFMGYLRSVGQVERKPKENQDETVYRKVDIESLNGRIVEFIMWDHMAEDFKNRRLETMEQPIIIAMSSCRVTRFRESYQLAATSATECYLNPQIPEIEQAKAQYAQRYKTTPPLRICKTPYEDVEKEKFRNRFPLKTLLKVEPETYQGVQFTTEATIAGINIKRNWFYMSCNKCMAKVFEQDGAYCCLDHGTQEKPSYRYCFKGFIVDQSETVPITFFTPGADDVVGYTCSELIAMHDGEDPQEIPSQIFDIEGQRNVFQIRFNQTGDTTSFILDQVFDKKMRQQPQHKPVEMIEGPSAPFLAPTDEEQTHKALPAIDLSKSPSHDEEHTIPPKQQAPGTPPSNIMITEQQDPEKMTDTESRTKPVKRALFPSETSKSKKQKATSDPLTAEKPRTRSSDKSKTT